MTLRVFCPGALQKTRGEIREPHTSDVELTLKESKEQFCPRLTFSRATTTVAEESEASKVQSLSTAPSRLARRGGLLITCSDSSAENLPPIAGRKETGVEIKSKTIAKKHVFFYNYSFCMI